MTHRILAVDDEQLNLKAIGRIFADSGYLLEFADSGATALEVLHSFPADLILLDVMMPGMDGYELCRQLKSAKKTADTMILFVSARGNTADRLKGYSMAGDDYITKPYDPDELQAKVNILLRLKKAQDTLRATNMNLERLVEAKTRELVKKERHAIVGQMIQGIVHNLRSPISAIDGMALLAAQKLAALQEKAGAAENLSLTQKLSDYLENILFASGQIKNIIDNLLLKSRNESTQEKQLINLNELLTRELQFLEADRNIKHKIDKTLKLSPDIPAIFATYTDFSQVCSNMIKNAADAMFFSPTRSLTISTRHDRNNIYLAFHDTGSGIAPEHLEQIFDPFFTTKPAEGNAPSDAPTGTGLGLHTCTELMGSYGARIRVDSQPNVGTTFTITIPLQGVAKGPAPPPRP